MKIIIAYIYRLDSDVPMPYGAVVKTTSRNKTAFGLEILEKKTGLAAWFVSHCNTVSQRELIVKKLMKHLPDNSVHVRFWPFFKNILIIFAKCLENGK